MDKISVVDQLTKLIQKINEKNPYYTVIAGLIIVLVIDYFLLLQFQLVQSQRHLVQHCFRRQFFVSASFGSL